VLKSFLTGRSQQVRCGSLSSEANVTCGVVQGNVLGPNLFAMYLDSLLTQLSVPAPAFADGLKLLVNLSTHGVALAQARFNNSVQNTSSSAGYNAKRGWIACEFLCHP
jgi:hypothetical protein